MKLQDLVGTDLRPFAALLKLCRKQGVTEVSIGEVTVKFGELPAKKAGETAEEAQEETDPLSPHALTPEQLIFYSVGGAPPP